MRAYSEALRKKIFEAVERGTSRSEVARTVGVDLSSVEHYVAAAREGGSLAPKRRPGSRPKLDEGARRLLEADLEDRPAATLPQRREVLRRVCGVGSATPRFLGSSSAWAGPEKKVGGCERTRRVPEGGLACPCGRRPRGGAAGVRGRDVHQHLPGAPVCPVAQGGAGLRPRSTQLGSQRRTLWVGKYVKTISYQHMARDASVEMARHCAVEANAEGVGDHARTAAVRLERM